MDSKNISESKTVREILIIIILVMSVLLILLIGINVGERKARYVGQFGDNFERNFMGPRGGMMGGFFDERGIGGHGAVGEIVSINLPQMVIAGPDNIEKVVVIGGDTDIHRFREDVAGSELKVGDFVVIIGSPNDQGQIEARLIRIMSMQISQ